MGWSDAPWHRRAHTQPSHCSCPSTSPSSAIWPGGSGTKPGAGNKKEHGFVGGEGVSVPFLHGNACACAGRRIDAHLKSTVTSSPTQQPLGISPSLPCRSLESRPHPSLQYVIWHLLAAFGSRAWDFLPLFTGCLSCGTGLRAVVPAGRAGMRVSAQERREKGEADLCASP